MSYFIYTIIITIVIYYIYLIINKIIKYYSQKNNGILISFERFQNMYNMKPSAWTLREDDIIYTYNVYETYYYGEISRQYPKEKMNHFYFSFWDYQKYLKFYKKIKYETIPEEIIDSWAKDIEDFKANYQKNMEKEVERIQKYIDNYDIEEKWKKELKKIIINAYNKSKEMEETYKYNY